MLCPVCGCGKSKVYWTGKDEVMTKRRRECVECLTHFETMEEYKRIIPPGLTGKHQKKHMKERKNES